MENRYSPKVSIDNLMQTCRMLAKWERLSGSEQELEAFRYFESEFQKLGMETELVLHDAYISLPVSARLVVNEREYPCQTHSMSVNVERLSAEIYRAASAEDITQENCAGKIVMTVARADYKTARRAEMVGAVGLICVQIKRICESIISNAWGSPTPYDRELFPQIPVVSITDETERQMLVAGCPLKALLSVATDTGWRKIPSLTATVLAENKTDEFMMFSGHLDSWYYGAIDNGTVNATQLEVARIAIESRKDLKRNLRIVMFSGHSHGRYAGSAWYADHHWEDLHENCVINVNADSLGGVGADDLTQSIIMPEARNVAKEVIRRLTGVEYVGARCGRLADQSFWINGVTSAFASFSKHKIPEPTGGNLGWWWHTPEDTYDKIDPQNLLRDAQIFAEFVMLYATSDRILLDFRQTAEEIRIACEEWNKKSREGFELSDVLERLGVVSEELERFYRADLPVQEYNRKVMEIGRELVPLNLTTGNIYANDSANPFPAVPSLMLMDQLIQAKPGSAEEKEIIVALVHKKNYIRHSLLNVLKIIRE